MNGIQILDGLSSAFHHTPLLYIVKLGFTGMHIIFLIFAQNIDCGYSQGWNRVLKSTCTLCFEQK